MFADRAFSEIWKDRSHPLLNALKDLPRPLTGRCGACAHKAFCGGCRIRAEVAGGDRWGADPTCYLTDEEIGL